LINFETIAIHYFFHQSNNEVVAEYYTVKNDVYAKTLSQHVLEKVYEIMLNLKCQPFHITFSKQPTFADC